MSVWISVPDLDNLTLECFLVLKTVVNSYDVQKPCLLLTVRLSEFIPYKTHYI